MRIRLHPMAFFFYVTWLLALPMEGPVLLAVGGGGSSLWFLLAHVLGLALVGYWLRPVALQVAARAGGLFTALLSVLVVQGAVDLRLLMPLLGFAAAPLAVKSCRDLLGGARPKRAAALALVGGNLGLALLQFAVSLPLFRFLPALLPLLALGGPSEETLPEQPDRHPWTYFGFLFAFQIVSGLMYASLFPAYGEYALVPGLELPFYMIAVIAAVKIYQHDADLLLAGGLTLAMAAFALLHLGGGLAVNLSMFAMQTAAGCLDMFLLALILQGGRSVAVFGYGLAVYCGGIAAGGVLGRQLAGSALSVGLAGGLALNVAALLLFFRHHRQLRVLTDRAAASPATRAVLPAETSLRLSERERDVLLGVLSGKNYRQLAEELTISESSVKTYMKRIYDKYGVSNRLDLLRALGVTSSRR